MIIENDVLNYELTILETLGTRLQKNTNNVTLGHDLVDNFKLLNDSLFLENDNFFTNTYNFETRYFKDDIVKYNKIWWRCRQSFSESRRAIGTRC